MRRSRLRQFRSGPGPRLADIPGGQGPGSTAFRLRSLHTSAEQGLGIFTMSSPADDLTRVSSILDCFGKATAWSNGRTLLAIRYDRCATVLLSAFALAAVILFSL